MLWVFAWQRLKVLHTFLLQPPLYLSPVLFLNEPFSRGLHVGRSFSNILLQIVPSWFAQKKPSDFSSWRSTDIHRQSHKSRRLFLRQFSCFKAGRWACWWLVFPCTGKRGDPGRRKRCRAPSLAHLTAAGLLHWRQEGGWLFPSHSLIVGGVSYWRYPKHPG